MRSNWLVFILILVICSVGLGFAAFAQQQIGSTSQNPDQPEPLSLALLTNFNHTEQDPAQPQALSLQAMSNFVPRLHMARFRASLRPVVCIAGDSVSSFTAGQIAPSELLWTALTTAIRIQNPDKAISFINFAVPSQTWTTLNGIAASHWPAWYQPQSEPWLGFVQAAHCTTLFLSFGVNDGWNISPAAIKSVLTKISGWSPVPDIVILTNMDINPSYKPLGTAGSLHAASYERTLAESGRFYSITNLPALGLIDVGRYFTQAVIGFDPAGQYLTRDPSYKNWQTVPLSPGTFIGAAGIGYTFTTENAGDFDIRAFFSTPAQDLLAPAGSRLVLSLGRAGAQYLSVEEQGGAFSATFQDSSSTSIHCQAAVPVDAGGDKFLKLEVNASGPHVLLILQGVTACDLLVPRFVAAFAPFIAVLNNPAAATTKITLPSSPGIGVMPSYQPIVRGSECWGVKPFAAGGNGINHTASPCSSMIWQAISSLNFNTD